MGFKPQPNPAPYVDAYVWVKPPGDSDGVSGPKTVPRLDPHCDPTAFLGRDSLDDAPQAGEWFQAEFEMLVKNAVPALPTKC
jgi:cellulose 1,4-beta-cellobiosidase